MFTLRKPYRLLPVLIGMALCPAVSYGQASALPNKPVRIIVPNAAAGPIDLVGRMIAPKLSEALRQNVIVDNRPSANGVIGSEFVAHATADGSVLAVGNSGTHAVNATLYKNPTYDPVRDFAADQRNHIQQPGTGRTTPRFRPITSGNLSPKPSARRESSISRSPARRARSPAT